MARERGENGIKRLPTGKWQVRITYTDDFGKRRVYKRLAETITDAKRLRKDFLKTIEDGGEKLLDGERLTFDRLAAIYDERKIIAAQYVGGRKVAGLRSYKGLSHKLTQLVSYFGRKRIKTFTISDIELYKSARLAEKVKKEVKNQKITFDEKGEKQVTVKRIVEERERAVSGVNRELELLRSMLRFAVREGWMLRSPFDSGASIISKADEKRRDRVLGYDEEKRLLTALQAPRRKHLLPIVITAIDTAMRRGELFKLQWRDVDLAGGLILVQATNTKTQTMRMIGMTPRVKSVLQTLFDKAADRENGLVFGLVSTIKRGWKSACEDSGIEGLTFHDLRHTAITRMVAEGLPASEIMKTSGHTQMTTFQRYVNPTIETAKRNAARLGEYNAARMNEIEIVNENFVN